MVIHSENPGIRFFRLVRYEASARRCECAQTVDTLDGAGRGRDSINGKQAKIHMFTFFNL